MRPRSGLCAPLPGLVPTPSSFTCAPSLPPRAAPEPPLRGTQRLLPGLLLTPCVWGHPEGHPSEVGSVTVSRAAFLGHTHRQLAHSPSDHKSPLGPRAPWLCLGAHSPLAWPFPLTAPAGSPGAPTAQGRLSAVLGRPHGVRCKKQQVPVGAPTQHSGQHPPPTVLTLDGPRRVQGPTVCWFSSPGAACGRVAKLLCACCTEGALIHTPLPEAQGSAGQAPPRVRGSPGQVPAGLSTQEPSTGPSLQSTPSPPVGQV